MFLLNKTIFVALLLTSTGVFAEGYVIGGGVEGDSVDGRAVTAFGDFGIGEKTWISVSAGSWRTQGLVRNNDARFVRNNDTMLADVGIDHWFKPFGVRLGASYWGNADILDSRDLRASLYVRGDAGSISAEYQQRNFEFDLRSDLLRGRTAKFSADGLGLSARLELGESWSFRVGGMAYEYSRNVRVQPDIDVLAFVSNSRLSMINSLIDSRINAGLEFSFGLKSIDVTAGRWETAVDGSTVDSYSLGFLTPVSDRLDMEFRIAIDDSETFGTITALSVYFYYFGGS